MISYIIHVADEQYHNHCNMQHPAADKLMMPLLSLEISVGGHFLPVFY